MCIGIGEDAEILLSVVEGIPFYWAEYKYGAAFSPIPTVRHLARSSLGHWDKSGC